MFTGLIEATAEVLENEGSMLRIARPKMFDDITIGSSIAISGVCLTITMFDEESMTFDLADVTKNRTTLGALSVGEKVNMERAMKMSERLEGHLVQGHVEGVGIVEVLAGQSLSVKLPEELHTFVVPRGSIALDGVSLTVAEFKNGTVTVALIPHTLSLTTLGTRMKGDKINIETDIVGRYVKAGS